MVSFVTHKLNVLKDGKPVNVVYEKEPFEKAIRFVWEHGRSFIESDDPENFKDADDFKNYIINEVILKKANNIATCGIDWEWNSEFSDGMLFQFTIDDDDGKDVYDNIFVEVFIDPLML